MFVPKFIEEYFLNHLIENNIDYFEHLQRSFSISYDFIFGSGKAIIHAIIPGLFPTSSTDIIDKWHPIVHSKCE